MEIVPEWISKKEVPIKKYVSAEEESSFLNVISVE